MCGEGHLSARNPRITGGSEVIPSGTDETVGEESLSDFHPAKELCGAIVVRNRAHGQPERALEENFT
ncbi:hypothetical protein GCM10009642_36610 [Nocardiopsis metallicus]